jgi:hypothetical protein
MKNYLRATNLYVVYQDILFSHSSIISKLPRNGNPSDPPDVAVAVAVAVADKHHLFLFTRSKRLPEFVV